MEMTLEIAASVKISNKYWNNRFSFTSKEVKAVACLVYFYISFDELI